MLTFQNFEVEIADSILDRGNDYYREKRVNMLTESKPGLWKAVVHGTNKYKVQVSLNGENITDWHCNCPYDMGDICKHVVAVIYKLYDHLEIIDQDDDFTEEETEFLVKEISKAKALKPKKDAKDKQTALILASLTMPELIKFCEDIFKDVDEAHTYFTHYFSDKIPGDPFKKYKKIVSEIINKFADYSDYEEYDYEDYDDFDSFENNSECYDELSDLIKKAIALTEKEDTMQAWAICQNITEQILKAKRITENSEDYLAGLMNEIVNTVAFIHSNADSKFQNEMFDYIMKEYHKPYLYNTDNADYYLDIMADMIHSQEQEKLFLSLLDNQIKENSSSKNRQHMVENLMLKKYYYFQNSKRIEEANAIIMSNLQFESFRQMLIEKCITEGNFEKAKILCREAIMNGKNKEFRHIGSTYLGHLHNIAELENNIPDQQKYAEELYWDKACKHDYYIKMKALYPADLWKDKAEEFIDYHLNKSKDDVIYRASFLADIFITEGYIDRLLSMIQHSKLSLQFIDEYAKHLTKRYPAEMLTIYADKMVEQGKITDRYSYEMIARYLKKMLKIQGGKEVVQSTLKYLLTTHSNRPAMKEIFKRSFPDLL